MLKIFQVKMTRFDEQQGVDVDEYHNVQARNIESVYENFEKNYIKDDSSIYELIYIGKLCDISLILDT